MIFGIDFDGTYARDPDLFRDFVSLLRSRGYEAVLVTGRDVEMGAEVRRVVEDLPIVYAGERWKRDAARAAGYEVDVWVDDWPEYVGEQTPLISRHRSAMFSRHVVLFVWTLSRMFRVMLGRARG